MNHPRTADSPLLSSAFRHQSFLLPTSSFPLPHALQPTVLPTHTVPPPSVTSPSYFPLRASHFPTDYSRQYHRPTPVICHPSSDICHLSSAFRHQSFPLPYFPLPTSHFELLTSSFPLPLPTFSPSPHPTQNDFPYLVSSIIFHQINPTDDMRILLTLALSLSLLSLQAQTKSSQKTPPLSEASPASVGISAERLTWVDHMLQESVEKGDIAGAVALNARNGKNVDHKAFGMADTEKNRSQKTDDIFRIASQTKAITSTAVMMLWEEGKFQLDDPISKYIPEFKDPQVLQTFRYADTTYTTRPASREITIRHLLTHTSGLGYGMIDGDERIRMIYQKAGSTDLFTTEPVTIGEVVKKLAKLPLHHNPGEKYTYSVGIDVLGYFVEVISGMPFDQFLEERIFSPLGMNDTGFYLPESK